MMILAGEICSASQILPLGPLAAPSGLGPQGRILLTQLGSAARIVPITLSKKILISDDIGQVVPDNLSLHFNYSPLKAIPHI